MTNIAVKLQFLQLEDRRLPSSTPGIPPVPPAPPPVAANDGGQPGGTANPPPSSNAGAWWIGYENDILYEADRYRELDADLRQALLNEMRLAVVNKRWQLARSAAIGQDASDETINPELSANDPISSHSIEAAAALMVQRHGAAAAKLLWKAEKVGVSLELYDSMWFWSKSYSIEVNDAVQGKRKILLSSGNKTLGYVAESMYTALNDYLTSSVFTGLGNVFVGHWASQLKETDPQLAEEINELVDLWAADAAFSLATAKQHFLDQARDQTLNYAALPALGAAFSQVGAMFKVKSAASVAPKVAIQAERAAADALCFAAGTMVAMRNGSRPIEQIRPGDTVLAFDFAKGRWIETEVLKHHANRYAGRMVAILADGERILATDGHPFWVVEGDRLDDRTRTDELLDREDENRSVTGRWVASHELQPGDVLLARDGQRLEVEEVAFRQVVDEPVYNLTVKDHPNFAVGRAGALVHNVGFCDYLERAGRAFEKTVLSTVAGIAVHGHHIVQKTLPRLWSKVSHVANEAQLLAEFPIDHKFMKATRRAWYIGKAQEFLAKAGPHGISLLKEKDEAKRYAESGMPMYNLCWAAVGNGLHSEEYCRAVWKLLDRAAPRGLKAVEAALADISTRLESHNHRFSDWLR